MPAITVTVTPQLTVGQIIDSVTPLIRKSDVEMFAL